MHGVLLTADTATTTNPFEGLFGGVSSIIQDIVPFLPVVILALIIIVGALLLSGKKGREHVKDNLIWYILGVSFIEGASLWAAYFISKFQF